MKKSAIFLFLITMNIGLTAQSLNAYKYVAVPKQFEGFDESNKYQLNTYSRSIFRKAGFELITTDYASWPKEALDNPCLVLQLKVVKQKSLLKNKLATSLINCKEEIVLEKEGASKIKEYKKGYQEAIKLSVGEYPLDDYSFDKNLAIQSKNSNVAIPKPVAPPTPTKVEIPKTILATTSAKTPNVYVNGSIELLEEIVTTDKVLFVSKSNPNQIIVRGKASSIPGVYTVIYTNEKGNQIETIGYYENNNWVMDLPNASGQKVKTVFLAN